MDELRPKCIAYRTLYRFSITLSQKPAGIYLDREMSMFCHVKQTVRGCHVHSKIKFIRERSLNKQGGGIFLGPEYFYCNTLEPRTFSGVYGAFFFHKFYNRKSQTIEPDFFFIAGLGPGFFFFFASSGRGNFFQEHPPCLFNGRSLSCMHADNASAARVVQALAFTKTHYSWATTMGSSLTPCFPAYGDRAFSVAESDLRDFFFL